MKPLLFIVVLAAAFIGAVVYKSKPVENLADLRDELSQTIIKNRPQAEFKDQREDGFGSDYEISLMGKPVSNPEVAVEWVADDVTEFLKKKGFNEIPVDKRESLNLDPFLFFKAGKFQDNVVLENKKIIAVVNIRGLQDGSQGNLIRIRFSERSKDNLPPSR